MNRFAEVYDELCSIVGEKYVITAPEELAAYSRDITVGKEVVPYAAVIPVSAEEISQIVLICNKRKLNLTIRGGGTAVSGGASSCENGILLSMERLNKIIEINRVDRIAIVEAGVVTAAFQKEVLKAGLCFPQNISSKDSCFIGGNIAVSSGSPKSLKYGPTKNHVLNLEVVLPDGQIMWTGKNVDKNATGYNLTQLIAGSEGTLGIITKVVVRLSELLEEILVLVPFRSIEVLFTCVQEIFNTGISPSSIEFIDKTGYELVSAFMSKKEYFRNHVEGLLWLEFEDRDRERLLGELPGINEFISRFTNDDILVADTAAEIKSLWSFRSRVGDAVINKFLFRDIDIVVPRSTIGQMYRAVKDIADLFVFNYTAFGHIGNGNFHVNIFKENTCPAEQWRRIEAEAIPAIFGIAARLGGTISGEHGIGEFQRTCLDLVMSEGQMTIMRKIKQVFDPNNILNPGKIF